MVWLECSAAIANQQGGGMSTPYITRQCIHRMDPLGRTMDSKTNKLQGRCGCHQVLQGSTQHQMATLIDVG